MVKIELGVSTGLAFKGIDLSKAVRMAKIELGDKLSVVELCPQDVLVSTEAICELRHIKEGEGLKYTVHADRQFVYNPNDLTENYLKFVKHNAPAMLLAEDVDAEHLVLHPAIEFKGAVPKDIRDSALDQLSRVAPTVPIAIETGVVRRDKIGQIQSYEEGRSPDDLLPYLKQPMVKGVVADVPKMSRAWERLDKNVRNLEFIERYITRCNALGLNINEVQFVDTEYFAEAQQFNERTSDLLAQIGYTNFFAVLETTHSRLSQAFNYLSTRLQP